MTTTCTRRFTFCAGHRVYGHESKCSHLHGHNYAVEVTVLGNLDLLGRVIDFSVIKSLVGQWIEDNWDHGFILFSMDAEAINAVCGMKAAEGKPQKHYVMEYNPTAENMARHLMEVVCPYLFKDLPIKAIEVTVHETENCYATVRSE